MKTTILFLLGLLIAGCKQNTSHPAYWFRDKEVSEYYLTVENQGHEEIQVTGKLSQGENDNECDPYFQEKSMMLASGKTETLYLIMKCKDPNPRHLVEIKTKTNKFFVQERTANVVHVVCGDEGCTW